MLYRQCTSTDQSPLTLYNELLKLSRDATANKSADKKIAETKKAATAKKVETAKKSKENTKTIESF